MRGLKDLSRSGAPHKLGEAKIKEILTLTIQRVPREATHWSLRLMAKYTGVSVWQVAQVWAAADLKPRRLKTFKISNDPHFADKVVDVVGLYLNPPDNAMVLSVDEKTQIQALDRTQPMLPLKPGQIERRTHDYKRHGTASLYAAFDILTGKVIGRITQRHRAKEFLEFLRQIDRSIYPAPGDLLHLDIKKLGRFRKPGHSVTGDRQQSSDGAGWEFVHVAIDDASRIAFSSVHPDERASSACQALLQALRYYRSLGIRFTRIMTNGSCYRSRRFRQLLRRLGLRYLYTRPYTPRTNGKAERFIQTSLREWAYARSYNSSEQRAAHLLPWLYHYNWHRPHASLDYNPPSSRAPLPLNNVMGLHS